MMLRSSFSPIALICLGHIADSWPDAGLNCSMLIRGSIFECCVAEQSHKKPLVLPGVCSFLGKELKLGSQRR